MSQGPALYTASWTVFCGVRVRGADDLLCLLCLVRQVVFGQSTSLGKGVAVSS